MNKEAQYKILFNLSSIITDYLPKSGGRFLDHLIKNSLGNNYLYEYLKRQSRLKIKKAKRFEKILVAADLNIGDAIIALSCVSALKKIFPDAEIDLVIKKSTKSLIEGNPNISNLFPIYNGAPYPTEEDLNRLLSIAEEKKYDLIINFSPMISNKTFGRNNVINYSLMAAKLIKDEFAKNPVNNIIYQAYNFIGEIFHEYLPEDFCWQYNGPSIYLSNEAIESAESFLLSRRIDRSEPIIMFNPDASSIFTRMPFDFQVELLGRLTDIQCSILLGAGHVEKYIEQRLINSLPNPAKQKVTIVPASMQLDEYTALIDEADIFISGDTGNLHLASAWKCPRDDRKSLRNKTAVFSIFGGTPPKMYGYDSNSPGFFAANQDAPSKVFIASSKCRNITCINKMAKTCSEVRCFQGLQPEEIVFAAAKQITSTVRSLRADNWAFINNGISSYKKIG